MSSAKKGSGQFLGIPKTAKTGVGYKLFKEASNMTVADAILLALKAPDSRMKTGWRSRLENIYRSLTGKTASNADIAEAVKRCS